MNEMTHKREAAKAKYNNSQEWQNFANGCMHNAFVCEYLRTQTRGRCEICNMRIRKDTPRERINIHHDTYDHVCKTPDRIYQDGHHVPDCEHCSKTTPDKFKECMSHLHFMHSGCHAILHGHSRKQYANLVECRIKYQNSSEWINFAKRCHNNPYVLDFLRDRDLDICQICHLPVEAMDATVHYATYDHACKDKKHVRVSGKDSKIYIVPDCETCHRTTPDKFLGCMNCLQYVHDQCHKQSHDDTE